MTVLSGPADLGYIREAARNPKDAEYYINRINEDRRSLLDAYEEGFIALRSINENTLAAEVIEIADVIDTLRDAIKKALAAGVLEEDELTQIKVTTVDELNMVAIDLKTRVYKSQIKAAFQAGLIDVETFQRWFALPFHEFYNIINKIEQFPIMSKEVEKWLTLAIDNDSITAEEADFVRSQNTIFERHDLARKVWILSTALTEDFIDEPSVIVQIRQAGSLIQRIQKAQDILSSRIGATTEVDPFKY